MPSLKVAKGRLNHSMFIRKIPMSAKPRTTSRASMRCAAAIGTIDAALSAGVTALASVADSMAWVPVA